MPIWVNPGGLTAIVVECFSPGGAASGRSNLFGSAGACGGNYSRVRLVAPELQANHYYNVGGPDPAGGALTDFKDGSDANTYCRAEATGTSQPHTDNTGSGVGDTKYNGGDGGVLGAFFDPRAGGGGGGPAGRYADGANAGTAPTPGGPSDVGAAGGPGGAIGDEGSPGGTPGGGAGGGGYTDPPPGVPDPNQPGGGGWIIIWNDSSGQVGGSGPGFLPVAPAFVDGFGDFPPPPPSGTRRKSAFIM